ncbi:HEPN domain-containing protein [Clostridium sp.]
MVDNIFNLLINKAKINTNIKGYEISDLKGSFILFDKEFGLRILLLIKSNEKRNLICGYSFKRKTVIKANNQDIIDTLIYLKDINSNLVNEIDIKEVIDLLKRNNKKMVIVDKNLAIYSEEIRNIERNKQINCYLDISSERLEVQEFIYYLSNENNICKIRCNDKFPKDKLIYLGDEFDLVINDVNEIRTRLKCGKYWLENDGVNLICLYSLYYDLSKYKNNFLYLEAPSQVVNDNIMHFMLRSIGLNNENINCEVTRTDNTTAYKVILLINNIEVDNQLGYSYVKFYSNESNTYELNKFREKLNEAKYSYEKYSFAEVIVNSNSLYDAYIQARELVIKTIQVMKFIIRNNILFDKNIKFWDRGSAEWDIEVSKWAYIECVSYNQVIIGNIDNICIYSNMYIGIDEKDKLLENKLTLQDLLCKSVDENERNILRTVKWVNKSWDSNEFEEKILYTVIAMEFLIANIPDKPLLDKQNRNKIKKYIKTELEIDKDIIEKVNQKISNSLTMMPMMNKFNMLLDSLGINLERKEIDIIKNIRDIRNDITHGREYKEIEWDEIDKVNSILILMVKRALEVKD